MRVVNEVQHGLGAPTCTSVYFHVVTQAVASLETTPRQVNPVKDCWMRHLVLNHGSSTYTHPSHLVLKMNLQKGALNLYLTDENVKFRKWFAQEWKGPPVLANAPRPCSMSCSLGVQTGFHRGSKDPVEVWGTDQDGFLTPS